MATLRAAVLPFAPIVLVLLVFLLLCSSIHSLTVHMVPHTHDDVGWLKTVDQYFIGSNRSLQQASVSQLITATMAALKRVPERKFIYVEQAFFQRWWRQQNAAMQADVRAFVANGQLEFINGGWCMHDEATTHYVDMIDQTTLGHQYILREFGESANPTIGWQVDPFGHSATQPTLLGHEIGFDALFFGRIDYQDHDQRVREKEMQFSWAPSPSLGPASQVWSEAALDGNYNPPDSFCWDYLCGGDNPQVQDRDDLEDKNVDSRVADFIRAAYQYAATRKGDLATMNIQFNMGTDFNYESAERYFINMDKIIRAVNRNGSIHAQYSTPSLYYKAKLQEGITWSVKTDDFFPYADGPRSQWTGYFTSRPGLKGYVRSSSITLQAARQLEVFTGGDGTGTEAAWEALAVAQHHDAVSGTERQHVAYDYAMRIASGMATAYRTLDSALSKLAANGTAVVDFHSCPLLNVSICPAIREAGDAFTVIVYNPQARARYDVLTLPLYSATNVTVTNSAGRVVASEVVPVPRTSAHTAESAPRAVMFTPFASSEGLGLGFDTFTVQPVTSTSSAGRLHRLRRRDDGSDADVPALRASSAATVSIENAAVRLTFDNATGLVVSWTELESGVSHDFSQNFFYYIPSEDGNAGTSNSYTFQPKANTSLFPVSTAPVTLSVFKGAQVQMVHQTWGQWLSQTWRLTNASRLPEVEWTIGPINITDGIAKEIVTRYTTPIQSQGELWTDSNGREFQRRLRDRRVSFNYTAIDRVSGNYYPVTTSVRLNDSRVALVVLVDRAEGTASLEDGAVELMLHRRLTCGCGFDEPLDETTGGAVYASNGTLIQRLGPGLVVTGKHRLALTSDPSAAVLIARTEPWRAYTPFHAVIAPSVVPHTEGRVGRLSFLRTALPPSVELISLHRLFGGSTLLRLAHSFASDDAHPLAAPVDIDLSTLFVQPISSIRQRTLTANADYKTRVGSRPPFDTEREVSEEEWERVDRMHRGLQDTSITIHPMQVVTFAISF